MSRAARAIIIEDGQILLMHRSKEGSQYYTLVGGQVKPGESDEAALVREIEEETSLQVTNARLVFVEKHHPTYGDQQVYLCEVAPHQQVAVQADSEEGEMNKLGLNLHTPAWVSLANFPKIAFRTPGLQQAITDALKNGFPTQTVILN